MYKEKGFTLVELFTVIIIIGFLAAMIIPRYKDIQRSGLIISCYQNVQIIGVAAEAYYTEHNTYPFGELIGQNINKQKKNFFNTYSLYSFKNFSPLMLICAPAYAQRSIPTPRLDDPDKYFLNTLFAEGYLRVIPKCPASHSENYVITPIGEFFTNPKGVMISCPRGHHYERAFYLPVYTTNDGAYINITEEK